MAYAKWETPKDVVDLTAGVVEAAGRTGKIKRGTNEATKAIERGTAKLIIMAEDVDPAVIVMHIPGLCENKKIPYCYMPTKLDVGRAGGINVPCAAIAVLKEGEAKAQLDELVKKLNALKGGSPVKEEKKPEAPKAEKKPEEKKEAPKEEKKEEHKKEEKKE